MTQEKSPEQLAEEWASSKYQKESKIPGRVATGAWLDGYEDFLAGYETRAKAEQEGLLDIRRALTFYADQRNYLCANPKLIKFVSMGGVNLLSADTGVLKDSGTRAASAIEALDRVLSGGKVADKGEKNA